MKIVKNLLIVLLIIITPATFADAVKLTITNLTNTDFTAKTRFGQVLGRITHDQPAVIYAPYLPFPKFAVSLVGDNGFNGSILRVDSGVFCSTQFTYHNCEFTTVSPHAVSLTIR